ncbi:MAG: hypothetical protein AAF772_03055 [Acidobacteriota bacterium]
MSQLGNLHLSQAATTRFDTRTNDVRSLDRRSGGDGRANAGRTNHPAQLFGDGTFLDALTLFNRSATGDVPQPSPWGGDAAPGTPFGVLLSLATVHLPDFADRIQGARQRTDDLKNDIGQLRDQLATAEAELAEVEPRFFELQGKFNDAKATYERLRPELGAGHPDVLKARMTMRRLEGQLPEVQTRWASARTEVNHLREQVGDATERLDSAQGEVDGLRRGLNSLTFVVQGLQRLGENQANSPSWDRKFNTLRNQASRVLQDQAAPLTAGLLLLQSSNGLR